MSKQTVIVSGGALEEEFTLNILNSEDTEFVIGVDRGLGFLYDHKIEPDYIVGDFDQRTCRDRAVLSGEYRCADPHVQSGERCVRHRDRNAALSGASPAADRSAWRNREPDGSRLGERADLKDRAGCRRGGRDHGSVE